MQLDLAPFALFFQTPQPPSLLREMTLGNIVTAVMFLLIVWFLIRWTSGLLEFLGNRATRARFFFKRLEPVVRITLWFIAAFVVIDLFSPSSETFWAGIASIGLALGLGAQDLIKNLIGGLVVLTDRPFQVGDRVQIGSSYGEIDHIGLRSTKMTTPDDTRVTIPNAEILTQHVYNSNSGVPDCLVVTDLYLPPDVDPEGALAIGREVAYSSPYLLIAKPVVAVLSDLFAERPYVRLRIKAYVYDHRLEPRMQSDITARAKKEFLRRGMLAGWRQPTERSRRSLSAESN